MQTTAISISGMVCGGCASRLQYHLEDVTGVAHAQVNVGSAIVTHDPAQATDAMLQGAVARAGYVAERLFRTGTGSRENA